MRCGNEIGCAARPRNGLFDIVKNDGGQAGARTLPWAAFTILRAGAQPVTKAVAEGVGFEPTIRFPVYTLSKRAPSATRPSLRPCRRSGVPADPPHETGESASVVAKGEAFPVSGDRWSVLVARGLLRVITPIRPHADNAAAAARGAKAGIVKR